MDTEHLFECSLYALQSQNSIRRTRFIEVHDGLSPSLAPERIKPAQNIAILPSFNVLMLQSVGGAGPILKVERFLRENNYFLDGTPFHHIATHSLNGIIMLANNDTEHTTLFSKTSQYSSSLCTYLYAYHFEDLNPYNLFQTILIRSNT